MAEKKIRVEDKAMVIHCCFQFFLCPINNCGFVTLLILWRTMLSLRGLLGCNTKACDQAIILDVGAQKSLGIPSHFAGLIMIDPSLLTSK
jgi:hypothetical protein